MSSPSWRQCFFARFRPLPSASRRSDLRETSVTVRLTEEEREWLRRKAYWEGATMSDLLRRHINYLIREGGYLRPPDDEPQDFGYEKEMIEFVNSVTASNS